MAYRTRCKVTSGYSGCGYSVCSDSTNCSRVCAFDAHGLSYLHAISSGRIWWLL